MARRRAKTDPFSLDVSAYGELPKLKGLFVAGTGFGVGKTLIAGAIARLLRSRGRRVEVFKPVVTGCRVGREGLISSEAEFLAACAESRRPLAEITPVRYKPAVTPLAAAQRADRPVDLESVFDAYRALKGACDCVLVEGPGGLCTPLTGEFWTVHFAAMTALPMLLVARPGLGAISDCLMAVHLAGSAGIKTAGVVINKYRIDPSAQKALDQARQPYAGGDDDLAAYTNPPLIAETAGVELLAVIPQDEESSVRRATLGSDVQFATGQVNWPRIIGLR